MSQIALRGELVRYTQKVDALGFNRGASGNLSVRFGSGFLITPSGMGAEGLTADDIVFVDLDGTAEGRWKPSSEWLFHRDLYAHRPEFNAVVHAHSIAATTLACLRRDIPAFHYMIALVGGDSIRCSDYATFGTQQLSDAALLAMRERKACLLGNHGMLAAGGKLAEAYKIAVEVETLSEIYLKALAVGQPVVLSAEEFRQAQQRFVDYGKPKA
jgi:L-fuculose-phosphate aldolase